MKKIGILTFYHDSCNYGGNFQAYATCRVMNELGYDAEQIPFIEKKIYRKLEKIGYR